jgi:hypothetical protein
MVKKKSLPRHQYHRQAAHQVQGQGQGQGQGIEEVEGPVAEELVVDEEADNDDSDYDLTDEEDDGDDSDYDPNDDDEDDAPPNDIDLPIEEEEVPVIEEVVILYVANEQIFRHPRYACPIHRFDATDHGLYCDQCYCFPCHRDIRECEEWDEHCHHFH